MRPPSRQRRSAPAALLAAAALTGAIVAGCSSEDVTGEPEDIGTLVEVVPEGSRCVHDRDDDAAHFEVRLRNTGEDERTVTVTPVRRFADGDEVSTPLDEFKMAVPGHGEDDDDVIVDNVSDDLVACFVRLDGGDPIEVELAKG